MFQPLRDLRGLTLLRLPSTTTVVTSPFHSLTVIRVNACVHTEQRLLRTVASPGKDRGLPTGYSSASKLLAESVYPPITNSWPRLVRIFKKIKPLGVAACPFANLPEKKSGRWGAGLTAAKMAECRWLKPVLVAQFEDVEWTGDGHLRHSRFIALRDDKKATDVIREG